MQIQDTLSNASQTLTKEGIGFALIGGFALAAHGIVRATQDIDLLVDGTKKDIAKSALIAAGFSLVHESDEVIQLGGFGQLDLLLSNRPPTKLMIKNATRINEFPVPVVGVEDLIGLKIQAYSNDAKREFQDKADIQSLLEKFPHMNLTKVKGYADLFGEWDFIEKLRRRI
jgi:hypothetical protein